MPIPTILLTGYLGAGKTTVLNHLLACPEVRERRPALLINEFGALGVDGHLVPPGAPRYEIRQGSVFCTCTDAQLVQALLDLAGTGGCGLLLVEATGIAETRRLEDRFALPMLAGQYQVQAVLCVVDAAGFLKVAAFLPVVQQQVRLADGLVLNKTDRAGAAELDRLAEVLAGLNRRAPQARVVQGRVPASFLAGLRHTPGGPEPGPLPPPDIVAAALESETPVDRELFEAALKSLGKHLLRGKGNVRFADGTHRFVEVVAGQILEKEACPGLGENTAFTAIGWRLSRERLYGALAAAVPDPRPGAGRPGDGAGQEDGSRGASKEEVCR